MTRLLALPLALLLLLLLGAAPAARAETAGDRDPAGAIWAAATAHGVRWAAPAMVAVAACESRLERFAVGDQGRSFGLFQLFTGGLLPTFYAWGYTDRWSAEQQADFVARYLAGGGTLRPWTCARLKGLA